MTKDILCESPFTIHCILKNKIMPTTLADICATEYVFINKEFIEIVCQDLEIKPQRLIK